MPIQPAGVNTPAPAAPAAAALPASGLFAASFAVAAVVIGLAVLLVVLGLPDASCSASLLITSALLPSVSRRADCALGPGLQRRCA